MRSFLGPVLEQAEFFRALFEAISGSILVASGLFWSSFWSSILIPALEHERPGRGSKLVISLSKLTFLDPRQSCSCFNTVPKRTPKLDPKKGAHAPEQVPKMTSF